MAETDNRSIIGYMREFSDEVKSFIQMNKLGKSIVVAAAIAVPAMGFANNVEAFRNIEQAAQQMGIVRDIGDMGSTHYSSLPDFSFATDSGNNSVVQPQQSLAFDLDKMAQYAVSDVSMVGAAENVNGLQFVAAKSEKVVDFAKELYYDKESKMFACDKPDIQEFVGNGNYVYYPVKSSDKNDDVKPYVDSPGHLKHNYYAYNESRDNPEYGFKRQMEKQKNTRGKRYTPAILTEAQMDQFNEVFGDLNQQNARFVPMFSTHENFRTYKVGCITDLELSKEQLTFLQQNFSKRLTGQVKEEIGARLAMMQTAEMQAPSQEIL